MSTFEELAKDYARQIRMSSDKNITANRIVDQINGLIYVDSRDPLSLEDKEQIIGILAEELGAYPKWGSGEIEIKEADNKYYLELVKYILQQVKQGKK
jgi:hypothetical protein